MTTATIDRTSAGVLAAVPAAPVPGGEGRHRREDHDDHDATRTGVGLPRRRPGEHWPPDVLHHSGSASGVDWFADARRPVRPTPHPKPAAWQIPVARATQGESGGPGLCDGCERRRVCVCPVEVEALRWFARQIALMLDQLPDDRHQVPRPPDPHHRRQ